MSLTKKTKDNPVTSIADTDLVMCSVNGVYHPISFENLMKAVRGGIQIGGRNLLLNSEVSIQGSYFLTGYNFCQDIPHVGEKLTVSIWGNLGVTRTHFTIFLNDGYGLYGYSNLKKVKEGLYQGTVVVQKALTEDWVGNPKLVVYANPSTATSMSTIDRIKVERGNVATDWTPAPEDIASGAWGGVNRFRSIIYAILQKGGLRNEYDKRTNQCPTEVEDDGRDGDKRSRFLGFERLQTNRGVSSQWKKPSERSFLWSLLWYLKGYECLLIYNGSGLSSSRTYSCKWTNYSKKNILVYVLERLECLVAPERRAAA